MGAILAHRAACPLPLLSRSSINNSRAGPCTRSIFCCRTAYAYAWLQLYRTILYSSRGGHACFFRQRLKAIVQLDMLSLKCTRSKRYFNFCYESCCITACSYLYGTGENFSLVIDDASFSRRSNRRETGGAGSDCSLPHCTKSVVVAPFMQTVITSDSTPSMLILCQLSSFKDIMELC